MRGLSVRGARRLTSAGVLSRSVEHGEQAQRSNGGPLMCLARQPVRNAGWQLGREEQVRLKEKSRGRMDLLNNTLEGIKPAKNEPLAGQIRARLDRLTKPPGSLGRLEEIALQYGLARGKANFPVPRKAMFVFCADHGVAAEGVSAYPPEVTRQMVKNFAGGGAAINVLCRQHDIDPVIVDMGVDHPLDDLEAVVSRKISRGTRNFLHETAMTRGQAIQCIETGIHLALAAARLEYGLLGTGEMGIGNSTAAAATLAAISGADPDQVVGAGTGVSESQLQHKSDVVKRALRLHQPDPGDAIAVLAAVGGFEIGGIAGFVLGAASLGIPIVVDGFIASAGALLAIRQSAAVKDYLIFSHHSAERGHQALLRFLDVRPLLDLDMRLGEGTGAALGMGLVDSAIRLYNEMATFDGAGVSGKA